MKLSLNWLKTYLNINLSPDELVKGLISVGIEVEDVIDQAKKLDKFVIGKVLERVKHPNADKLSLTKVDVGDKVLSIVCGAPNVDAGQTVCVALVGAIVPNGEFEIKKSKIRGELSEGMICSAKELNLGDDHSGIMVLPDELKIGSPFAEYLKQNDTIIEISITPNRGDLLSHIGVGREAGFLVNEKIKLPDVTLKQNSEDIKNFISVEVSNPDSCKRYCGILVKNVKIKESLEWMRNYLQSAGLRPINNIVDITNFVMMECGQPLHAFDYDKIGGKKIIVRDAGSDKKFTTLDGKERDLKEDYLLICDADKPVGLAGIMGGANSEISNDTKNVFIESAYFDPVVIRKASKLLGLQTDSSYRFERGVDIEITEWACKRAASLMAEFGEGEIVGGIADIYPNKIERSNIGLRIDYLNRLTGIEFNAAQVKDLLGKIDIKYIEEKDGRLMFEIPYFRNEDIQREVDLTEEVLRLYGYANITDSDRDMINLDTRDYSNKLVDIQTEYKKYFAGRGFKEIITNSLISEEEAALFSEDYISLQNAGKGMNVLRTNLIVGALNSVRYNLNHKVNSLKLFEVGNVFKYGVEDTNNKILQNKAKILILAGEFDLISSNKNADKSRNFDINDIKGETEMLFGKFNIEINKFNDYYYTDFYDCKIDYLRGNVLQATLIQFSVQFLKKFDIEKPVFVCEIY